MITLPLLRVSQELYDKVKKIHHKTGLSMRVIMDNMGKNLEFELKIIVKEENK